MNLHWTDVDDTGAGKQIMEKISRLWERLEDEYGHIPLTTYVKESSVALKW